MSELNINANNTTNVSTSNLNVKLGKLSACGIELENIELNANMIITDENIKTQCDFVGKLFGQLLAKFGDHINDLMDAETDNVRARKNLIEEEVETEKQRAAQYAAEVETEKKRAEQYAAEAAYYNARTEKIKGENNDAE